jgi:predicted ArsR family transcriptional regulator
MGEEPHPMALDSRSRIVEILKRRQQASVTELSQALGLTPVTIRHHLDSLYEDDVVSEPVPRRKSGPGRPEMVYALTERADALTPRNYGELCTCLLEALDDASADPGTALTRAGSYLGERVVSGRGRSRLDDTLAFLETRGYFPSVERAGDDALVVLANCPYLEAARARPQICRFDVALLERALGAEVEAEASIAAHDAACRLRITLGPTV